MSPKIAEGQEQAIKEGTPERVIVLDPLDDVPIYKGSLFNTVSYMQRVGRVDRGDSEYFKELCRHLFSPDYEPPEGMTTFDRIPEYGEFAYVTPFCSRTLMCFDVETGISASVTMALDEKSALVFVRMSVGVDEDNEMLFIHPQNRIDTKVGSTRTPAEVVKMVLEPFRAVLPDPVQVSAAA